MASRNVLHACYIVCLAHFYTTSEICLENIYSSSFLNKARIVSTYNQEFAPYSLQAVDRATTGIGI